MVIIWSLVLSSKSIKRYFCSPMKIFLYSNEEWKWLKMLWKRITKLMYDSMNVHSIEIPWKIGISSLHSNVLFCCRWLSLKPLVFFSHSLFSVKLALFWTTKSTRQIWQKLFASKTRWLKIRPKIMTKIMQEKYGKIAKAEQNWWLQMQTYTELGEKNGVNWVNSNIKREYKQWTMKNGPLKRASNKSNGLRTESIARTTSALLLFHNYFELFCMQSFSDASYFRIRCERPTGKKTTNCLQEHAQPPELCALYMMKYRVQIEDKIYSQCLYFI